jgi:hypothetical protein
MSEVTPVTPEIPFVWPDYRCLAGITDPTPDMDALLANAQLILGVVHGLSDVSVGRLRSVLTTTNSADSNGNDKPAPDATKVRLIVTLYPTCTTTSDVLLLLLQLQTSHPSLEVRLVTCNLRTGPESTLACYKTVDSVPIVMFGSSANFENPVDDSAHLTLVFSPEPLLAAEWQKWFDVKWLKAACLNEERTRIPSLVLPKGTVEAAEKWRTYEQLMFERANPDEPEAKEGLPAQVAVEVTIDPVTNKIVAKTADGTPVPTVSAVNKLPQVSPVYRKLAQLLEMGHLVSVDKTTRLAPFEVSVKPKWFGLETLKQIGSVKRQVSYRISALTKDELKQLENRRKKTGELLDLFSFSLADGQRWMPTAAEELFQRENSRVNTEAAGILSKLVAGDLNKFIEGRRKTVSEDANRMYGDLFPEKKLSDDALDEIMDALKKRFEGAQKGSFLPQLSFNRVSLPQPQDSAWKSQLGSALHLLLSIVRFPRKACKNGSYFGRGMTAKPPDILKAMNLLNDPFVAVFDRFEAKERAEADLDAVEAIESSDISADEKCQQLFRLLGHEMPPLSVDGQSGSQREEARANYKGGGPAVVDSKDSRPAKQEASLFDGEADE